MNVTDGCWRTVCNLRSLLGDSKDVHIGNLTQQHPAKRFENFASILTYFQEHYDFAYTMYTCYVFWYTILKHGLAQTATLEVLKRIIADFATSSVSTIIHLTWYQWKHLVIFSVASQPIPAQLDIPRYYDSSGKCPPIEVVYPPTQPFTTRIYASRKLLIFIYG